MLTPVLILKNQAFATICDPSANCIDTKQLPQSSLLNNPGTATLTLIFNLVFSLVGAVSVIVIILAGFSYITSRGQPEKTARAKDAILYAIIGLIIVGLGVTIVTFVTGQF